MAFYQFSTIIVFLSALTIQHTLTNGDTTTEPTTILTNITKTSEAVTDPSITVTTTNVPQIPRLNMNFVCGFHYELYNKSVKNGTEESIRPDIRLVPVCCSGFKRSGITCVPHCEGGCGEGVCKYPGMCVCEKKFQYCHFGNYSRPRPSRFQNKTCLKKCKNGVCLSNSTCQCNQGFRHQDEWTRRYTNSSTECLPFCFPFCSNRLFSTPEQCECSYSHGDKDDDDSISIELDVDKPKSFKHLKKLFKQYGHPSFGTGTFLGLAAGYALGSRDKSKQEQSNSGWITVGGNAGVGETALRGMYDNNWSHSVPGSNNFIANSSGIRTSGNRLPGWVIPGNNYSGSSSSGTGLNVNIAPGWIIPRNNNLGSSSSGLGTNGNRPYGWVIPSSSGSSSGNWNSYTNYRPHSVGGNIPGISSSSGLSGIGWSSSSGGRGLSSSSGGRIGGGRVGGRG